MPPDYWKIGKNSTLYVVIWRSLLVLFSSFFSSYSFFSFFLSFFLFLFFPWEATAPPQVPSNDAPVLFNTHISNQIKITSYSNMHPIGELHVSDFFRHDRLPEQREAVKRRLSCSAITGQWPACESKWCMTRNELNLWMRLWNLKI